MLPPAVGWLQKHWSQFGPPVWVVSPGVELTWNDWLKSLEGEELSTCSLSQRSKHPSDLTVNKLTRDIEARACVRVAALEETASPPGITEYSPLCADIPLLVFAAKRSPLK